MKEVKDFSKEELFDLLADASKNWLAHDGLWFLAAEKEFRVELDPDAMYSAGALQTLKTLAAFIDTCLSEQSDAE